MAITLTASPNQYNRAYDTNTVYYKISSTQVSQPNFRFVVKLYSPTNVYLSTIKLTADSNGYGWYNPTSYISNFLTSDPPSGNTLKKCTNSYGLYKLNFGEEYGIVPVEYTGTTNSTKYYYNGCQIYENYDSLYGNYYWTIKDSSTIGHFLTPSKSFYVDPREKIWAYFNVATDGITPSLEFTYYKDGAVVDTIGDILTLSGDTMYNIGIGPANPFTGTTPASWDYYTVNLYSISQDYFGTDYYIVYNKPKCNYNDWSEVYWLNEHGGWSTFVFNKRKYKETRIRRNTYDKFLTYGYTLGSRGSTQYLTMIDENIMLNTDWINDTQNLLIKSLLMSPDVRILENGYLIPYIVLEDTYQEKNTKDDGLYSYQIKLTKANTKIIQNG